MTNETIIQRVNTSGVSAFERTTSHILFVLQLPFPSSTVMAGAKVSRIYIYIYRYKRPKCTLHRYLGACNWRNRTHYVSSVTLPPFCTHASPPPFSLPPLSSFLLALFISLHPPLHLSSNISSSSSFLLSCFFSFFLMQLTLASVHLVFRKTHVHSGFSFYSP